LSYADLKLFIGGEWLAGGGRKTQPVINPATATAIGELPHASCADLDRALEAARQSFPLWRAKAPHGVCRNLQQAADLLRERTVRLATGEGKIIAETLGSRVG
jgi:succinate-semialdehyde dehydrogenase/glutarate-semialdehyde dehydrogenase